MQMAPLHVCVSKIVLHMQINDTVKNMMAAGESAKDIQRHLDMREPTADEVHSLLGRLIKQFREEHFRGMSRN